MSISFFYYPNSDKIAYLYQKRKNAPVLIYLHGLLSSHQSQKGHLLSEFAQKNGFSFLSVDYFSHGLSDGKPWDFRIQHCLEDVLNVIQQEDIKEPLILVGSSLGGWIALLLAEKLSSQTKGVVTVACAADFTNIIWNNIFDDKVKALLKEGNVLGPSPETKGYCFSYQMFQEAEPYFVLNRQINYNGPVLLLHGDNDELIPFENSLKVKDRLSSHDVSCLIIKGGNHSLNSYDLSSCLTYFIKGLDNVK